MQHHLLEVKYVRANEDPLWPLDPNHDSLWELMWATGEILSLAWKDLFFLWKAARAEGCVFFLLPSVLFQKKQIFIYKEQYRTLEKYFPITFSVSSAIIETDSSA